MMLPVVKRLAVSAFLVVHLSALLFVNLPASPLSEKLGGWSDLYLQPTGQWQSWGMFAPDPSTDTITLTAVVRDSRGLLHHYSFPRTMDKSAWEGVWGYRHSKYANNVGLPTGRANREFAARFVLRELTLKADDYPADVQLVHEVWPTKLVNTPADAPPATPWQSILETYHFPNLAEATP